MRGGVGEFVEGVLMSRWVDVMEGMLQGGFEGAYEGVSVPWKGYPKSATPPAWAGGCR